MADYTDNFNRGDSNDLGSPWVEKESAVNAIGIYTSRLKLASCVGTTIFGFAYWNDVFSDNQYSELVYIEYLAGSGWVAGPAVRIDSAGSQTSATLYAAIWKPSAGTISLRKYVAQTLNDNGVGGTELGSWSGGLSSGDTLRLEVTGNSLTVKKNGSVIIGPVTDTAITSGKAGVVTNGFTSSTTDVSHWDNWAGGDVPALELEDTKVELNSQKEVLENLLVLATATIQILEDLEAEARAVGLATDNLEVTTTAVAEVFEVLKADIRASMDFSDAKTEVVAHALQLVDLLTHAAGAFPAQDNVQISAGIVATGALADLLVNIRAAITQLVFLRVHAAAAQWTVEAGVPLHIAAQPLPDFSGPFLRRFVYPRPGATNVPLNAPVVIRIRDEGRGVDIDTALVEIDGVKYRKGDPEFTYEAIDGKKEYRVTVRPAADWLPNKVITVRAYCEDLAGNPGLKMERE